MDVLLQDLHNMGLIVYFRFIYTLKDDILLDPEYINKIYKSLLDYGRKRLGHFLEALLLESEIKTYFSNRKFYNKNSSLDYAHEFLMKLKSGISNKTLLEICSDAQLRDKINLFKLSFDDIFDEIQKIVYNLEESFEKEINKTYKSIWPNEVDSGKDISQLISVLTISDLNPLLRLCSPFKSKTDIKFPKQIFLNFDFILKRGEDFICPLLFPKNIYPDKKKKIEHTPNINNEYSFKYFLPHKPLTTWKRIFLKIRNVFDSKNMVEEYFWNEGLIFIFREIRSKINLKFDELLKEKQKKNFFSFSIHEAQLVYQEEHESNPYDALAFINITLRSDEKEKMIIRIFHDIDKAVQNFFRENMKINSPLPFLYNKYIENAQIDNKKEIVRCFNCGELISYHVELRSCEICQTKEFLLLNKFLVLEKEEQGGMGEIIQAKINDSIVAVKRRLNNKDKLFVDQWENEVK